MANTYFDSKSFNAEAFGKYVENIPNAKQNALAKSQAIGVNQNAHDALASQTGSLYARVPYTGRISGKTSQNNDGNTDIRSSKLSTFEQGFVTASRMDGWTERDFSQNLTGKNFMDAVAEQIADYKYEVKQTILLKILKGIFSMDTTASTVASKAAKSFIENHTYDISGKTGLDAYAGAGTLNTAIQKACGDNKDIFNLVIMHSTVATGLENLRLLQYLTYTDADGITRPLAIGTWNGRNVLIDDEMPTGIVGTSAGIYTLTIGGTPSDGDVITVDGVATTLDSSSSSTATQAATAVKASLDADSTFSAKYATSRSGSVITITEKDGSYGIGAPEVVANGSATANIDVDTEPEGDTVYTSYTLGRGSINLDDIGDVTPYEMSRDAKTNGGQNTLYVRDRFIIGAQGVSFEKPASITASASNADIENGANWAIVNNGEIAIPHKSIAIARIVSRG